MDEDPGLLGKEIPIIVVERNDVHEDRLSEKGRKMTCVHSAEGVEIGLGKVDARTCCLWCYTDESGHGNPQTYVITIRLVLELLSNYDGSKVYTLSLSHPV